MVNPFRAMVRAVERAAYPTNPTTVSPYIGLVLTITAAQYQGLKARLAKGERLFVRAARKP